MIFLVKLYLHFPQKYYTVTILFSVEAEFGEFFTAMVTGDTPEEVYEKVKDVIQEQSGDTIWVPAKDKL